MRNRQIDWLLRHGPLRPVQRELDRAVAAFGVPPGRADYADAVLAFDHVFHLGLPELEYPRRELPERIEFVGPLPAPPHRSAPIDHPPMPDAGAPIIHVSQGTFDNLDHDRLILPTVRALAGEDCRLVVSTGGRPVDQLRSMIDPWPRNVRVTDFVDYGRLLPNTEIMITNGGYGGVQLAARYGVPLIVAGDTEEKPEVAARVAWAGVGIDLHTGRPDPGRIRRAVRRIRVDDRYRLRAAETRLAAERLPDPLHRIAEQAEAMIIADSSDADAGAA
jgi:UDP:flavonoid glycosyltransferase YjiC (YdhE family)